ncbi:putative deoxyribonuclease TATDN3 [Gracilariopsis chorda]|uniref:Putative deoxyribonuclease TATDN3 n=1 Tax=Gracilariopsis chorda TaxID=448386 RepID=A0A2V3IZF6_9FLOR|nr:putative deoxyribonuclease TATDN3 [Gracilariopsis chorda]|eukprot:PXF47542.1 putative deoxyribonuclease TATDN3 [Gracilariopsis chorda]
MIDTHAHLTDRQFSTDLRDVITRAQNAGVQHIICVSESLSDARNVLRLSSEYERLLHPAVGLHPQYISSLSEDQLYSEMSEIRELIDKQSSVIAIGEVGLDFTPRVLSLAPSAEKAKHTQRQIFDSFLEIAQRTGLPLTIHSRSAGHHALTQVCEANAETPLTAIMHAFDGRPVYAVNALKKMPESLYFSIPPSVVRSSSLPKLVRQAPLERLLLESDAPALPAVARERNEPKEVVKAVEMIAAVRSQRVDDVRQQLLYNTVRVFPSLAINNP